MADQTVTEFLGALRKAVSNVQLYPEGHPYSDEAIRSLSIHVPAITQAEPQSVLSLVGGAFYLNRQVMPQSSIEHRSMVHTMERRGLESITLREGATTGDLRELAGFLSGESGDVPAEGTVVLNERPYSRAELEAEAGLSGLRRSYASSIDLLRGVSAASLDPEAQADLESAVWSVESLLEQVLLEKGASLLLASIKTHDQYTFFHSVNSSILAMSVGRALGLDDDQLIGLGLGGLLHDLGKTKIAPEIITHPGRLDDSQWVEIKRHPQEGAQAILAASGPGQEIAARVALEHHARFDRDGYPTLKPGKLHLFSRIVAVCDTYDALTTRRSYKRALPPTVALDVITEAAGSQLDPDVVGLFIDMMGIYPAGSLLRLQTGDLVMVVESDESGAELAGAVVMTADGEHVDDLRVEAIDQHEIVDLVLPDEAGIAPAALLEGIHVAGNG